MDGAPLGGAPLDDAPLDDADGWNAVVAAEPLLGDGSPITGLSSGSSSSSGPGTGPGMPVPFTGAVAKEVDQRRMSYEYFYPGQEPPPGMGGLEESVSGSSGGSSIVVGRRASLSSSQRSRPAVREEARDGSLQAEGVDRGTKDAGAEGVDRGTKDAARRGSLSSSEQS